jgi:hypothetical protein
MDATQPLNDSKPMKGKYDRRGSYKRTPEIKAKLRKNGPKPKWAKHLTRNAAAVVLKQVGIEDQALTFLSSNQWVPNGKDKPYVEVPDIRLRWEVFKYLWDRLEGRPFVAINPDADAKPSTIINDNRLQMAIQNLIPSAPAKKTRKPKLLTAEAQVLDPSTQEDPTPV